VELYNMTRDLTQFIARYEQFQPSEHPGLRTGRARADPPA